MGGGAELRGHTTPLTTTTAHEEEGNRKMHHLRFINNLFNVFYINVFISKLNSFLAPRNNLSLSTERLKRIQWNWFTRRYNNATISQMNKQMCYNGDNST